MIYLDNMGHLFSDKGLDELHTFATRMGLRPEWNHYSRHFPHFDITSTKVRNRAIEMGATLIKDRKEMIKKVKEVQSLYKKIYPLPHYQSKGLYGQKIIRVDFDQYFKSKTEKS